MADGEMRIEDINSSEALRAYLESRSPDLAKAVAVRLALRILPSLSEVIDRETARVVNRKNAVLAAFRANLISWATLKFGDAASEGASSAGKAAGRFAGAVGNHPAVVCAGNVVSAVASKASAPTYAITALGEALDIERDFLSNPNQFGVNGQSKLRSTAIGFEVLGDLQRAEESTINLLVSAPLWTPQFGANFLADIQEGFSARLAGLGASWAIFGGWYDSIRLGGAAFGLPETLERQTMLGLANADDAFWEADPDEVARNVAGRVAAAGTGANPEPTQLLNPILVPVEHHPAHSDFHADIPEAENDSLGRSIAAWVLAGRLNQIWDAMNGVAAEAQQDDNGPDHTYDSAGWTGHTPHAWDRRLRAGFVVHVDAPWGGGKTSFANYLTRILNPYRDAGPVPSWLTRLELEKNWREGFRRPWHIVQFNAWRYEHVDPPWWEFSQAIRKQCLESVRHETNERLPGEGVPPPDREYYYSNGFNRMVRAGWSRFGEWAWRLFTPSAITTLLITVATLALTFFLLQMGLVKSDGTATEVLPGATTAATVGPLLILLLTGGAAGIWKLVTSAVQSLSPGVPDAAKNYSLGAGDPLERFRSRFAWMIEDFDRPVIVVVDDLDRCRPAYVVELIRGMQTLLLSPRVVFLLLGDRDWIERAFSEHYKDLEGVAAGPEHSFGARFVEKAIQLSFVLPDVGDEKKDQYLKHLLAPKTKPAQPTLSDAAPLPQDLQQRAEAALAKPTFQAREHAMNSLRADIKSSTEITGQAETDALRNLNIQLTLKAATDKTAEEATGHMMLGLSKYLPDNPRQIKRIINTVTLLQELLRADDPEFQPGDEKWQLLVRWIVLMIEWPKSWYTLSKYPGLADMILGLNPLGAVPAERAEEYAGLLKKNGPVIQLLELKRVESNWRSRAIGSWQIAWLVRYAPPTSGSLFKLP